MADNDLLGDETDESEDEGLLAGSSDYDGYTPTTGVMSGLGPDADAALATLVKSNEQARAALQRARQKVEGRKYNNALALLAVSGALGKPTRSGAFMESFGNAADALVGPLREKQQFEQARDKDLLDLDTNIAGLDERTATAQLQLAQLRAKLEADKAKAGNDRVILPNGDIVYRSHQGAREPGLKAWTPSPAETKVSVNTEQSLYGGLGKNLADEYTAQYKAAAAAPERLQRNDLLRQLLKAQPYTGSMSDWKLKAGKFAKGLGFNYAKSDIKNTELLFSLLGQETLDNVKASGLGSGNGFTDKDLKFLERVVGGSAELDDETLADLADLHERSTRLSVDKWNGTFSRLDPARMKELGLTRIDLPKPVQTVAAPSALAAPPDASDVAGEFPPSANPDDDLVAIDPNEGTGGVTTQATSVPPPLLRRQEPAATRAPPGMEDYLREHPDTWQKFQSRYKYLPSWFRKPR